MRSREWRGRIVRRTAAIASLPSDSPDERLRKSTLVLTSILITVFSCVWVGTYAALGLWDAALVPLGYQVASLLGLAFLARTKRYSIYRASQIGLMLLLPFLLQWSLGGFVESGSVAIWAFFAPLAALVFYGPRRQSPGSERSSGWWSSPRPLTASSRNRRTPSHRGSLWRSSR